LLLANKSGWVSLSLIPQVALAQDAVKQVLKKRDEKIHHDAQEKWQRANSKVDVVKQMFDTIDDDGNGTLELDEFKL